MEHDEIQGEVHRAIAFGKAKRHAYGVIGAVFGVGGKNYDAIAPKRMQFSKKVLG